MKLLPQQCFPKREKGETLIENNVHSQFPAQIDINRRSSQSNFCSEEPQYRLEQFLNSIDTIIYHCFSSTNASFLTCIFYRYRSDMYTVTHYCKSIVIFLTEDG